MFSFFGGAWSTQAFSIMDRQYIAYFIWFYPYIYIRSIVWIIWSMQYTINSLMKKHGGTMSNKNWNIRSWSSTKRKLPFRLCPSCKAMPRRASQKHWWWREVHLELFLPTPLPLPPNSGNLRSAKNMEIVCLKTKKKVRSETLLPTPRPKMFPKTVESLF